jgi:hypothetical protein
MQIPENAELTGVPLFKSLLRLIQFAQIDDKRKKQSQTFRVDDEWDGGNV